MPDFFRKFFPSAGQSVGTRSRRSKLAHGTGAADEHAGSRELAGDSDDIYNYRNVYIGSVPALVGRFTYGYKDIEIIESGEGARLSIGSFCSIAAELRVFLGGNHRTEWVTTYPFGHIYKSELGGEEIVGHPKTNGDVTIGNDVWIAQNVTVMSGINIGDGAVLAANSTVTKDVGPYEVWGGNPARLIKYRFNKNIIDELLRLKWWEAPVEQIRKIAPILSNEPSDALISELKAALHVND